MAAENEKYYTVVFKLTDWQKFASGHLASVFAAMMGEKPIEGAQPISMGYGNATEYEEYSNYLLTKLDSAGDCGEALEFDEWVKNGKPETHDKNKDYDRTDDLTDGTYDM